MTSHRRPFSASDPLVQSHKNHAEMGILVGYILHLFAKFGAKKSRIPNERNKTSTFGVFFGAIGIQHRWQLYVNWT